MVGKKKRILMLLSPRYEMAYRFVDAILGQSQILQHYELVHMPYSPAEEAVPDFGHLSPDAIITSVAAHAYDVAALIEPGIPVVNISSGGHEKMMSLYVEEESLIEVIVRHAVANEYEELVFMGTSVLMSSLEGQVRLLRKLGEREGVSTKVCWVTEKPGEKSMAEWMDENEEVVEMCRNLSVRTLFYTHHDGRAVLINTLLKQLGVDVPEKAGVLGRANHQQVKLAVPPISSVETPYLKMAAKAVEMIEKAWAGERPREGRVPSGAVVPRASTTGVSEAIGPKLSRVSQLIEKHAFELLSVDDLARILRISRSSLERNYKAVHGVSPAVALRRVQLKRAATMLKQTDMTVGAVAAEVGYKSVRSFYKAFEQQYGCKPGEWRGS